MDVLYKSRRYLVVGNDDDTVSIMPRKFFGLLSAGPEVRLDLRASRRLLLGLWEKGRGSPHRKAVQRLRCDWLCADTIGDLR